MITGCGKTLNSKKSYTIVCIKSWAGNEVGDIKECGYGHEWHVCGRDNRTFIVLCPECKFKVIW